jgi:hypothetical protein
MLSISQVVPGLGNRRLDDAGKRLVVCKVRMEFQGMSTQSDILSGLSEKVRVMEVMVWSCWRPGPLVPVVCIERESKRLTSDAGGRGRDSDFGLTFVHSGP